jgi:hypothetical protein
MPVWDNAARAASIDKALEAAFPGVQAHASDEERLTDLLTNLRHWAQAKDIDFEKASQTSNVHFDLEWAKEAQS